MRPTRYWLCGNIERGEAWWLSTRISPPMGEMRYTQTIQGNYGNSMHLNDSLLLTHIFLSLALHCWNPSTTRGEQPAMRSLVLQKRALRLGGGGWPRGTQSGRRRRPPAGVPVFQFINYTDEMPTAGPAASWGVPALLGCLGKAGHIQR